MGRLFGTERRGWTGFLEVEYSSFAGDRTIGECLLVCSRREEEDDMS
jgi:hypothetical protein